jgi:addiction module RelE/StbE family toxin
LIELYLNTPGITKEPYLIECDPLIAQAVYALSGDWQDHRDCHLKPDLVLIYRKPDDAELQLVRLGSHSELGL